MPAPPDIHAAVRRRRLGYACTIALLVVVSGIATLPQYGVTCDEAYGELFFGERYLHYWLTLDRHYLNFGEHRLPVHQREPDLYRSTWRDAPAAFPPLADTVSALSMEWLGRRWRLMDLFDAFHLPTILAVGVLLVVLYVFTAPRLGSAAALAGVTLLGSLPRFWGDMHDNVKDVPEAALFAFAVVALARWSARPSWPRALLAGVAAGAALAVKVNAVFLPLVVVAGLWPWERSRTPWRGVVSHLRSAWTQYAAMLVCALATLVFSWPWLHRRTLSRLARYVQAFASQGDRAPHPGWNPDPLVQVIATTPVVVLLLLAVGVLALALRLARGSDSDGTARLLLAWAAVPVLRASVPGAVNFDGIRHFLEFLPATALVAGFGAVVLVRAVPRRWRAVGAAALSLAVLVEVGAAHVRYHPFQPLYFNRLVGGLSGAAERHDFPEATDYWGSSYRQGIRWLNATAEPGAFLFVPVFPHIVGLVGPLWMRADLQLAAPGEYALALATGRPVYVMFVTRSQFYDAVAEECLRERQPVHELRVDGRAILLVYRVQEPAAAAARGGPALEVP